MEMWISESPSVRREFKTLLSSVPRETITLQVDRDIARATFPEPNSTRLDLPSPNLTEFRRWTRRLGWEARHVPGTEGDTDGPILLVRLGPGEQPGSFPPR